MTDSTSTTGAPAQQNYVAPGMLTSGSTQNVKHLAPHSSTIISQLGAVLGRLAIGLAGVCLVAGMTYANVVSHNLQGAELLPPCGLALVLIVGAGALSRARGFKLAMAVLAVLAGEMYQLDNTMNWSVTTRDDAAAVVDGGNDVRKAAQDRLSKALAVQVGGDDAARLTIATPSCRAECRTLLEGQASKLAEEVTAARAALANAPVVKDSHPFETKLGIDPATHAMVVAALLGLALNVGAAVFVSVGFAPSDSGTSNTPKIERTRRALKEEPRGSAAVVPTPVNKDPAEQSTEAPPFAPEHRSKQLPNTPAVVAAQGKIVDLVKGADGKMKTSVRGLAALIGNASTSTTHTALVSLVAAGILERCGDTIALVRSAA